MNPVVHFEMPYENAERAAAFYESAFGWRMQRLGAEMGNYVLATTTKTGDDGRPAEPGAINGGLFEKKAGAPMQHPSVVIAVNDVREALRKVESAGGKVSGDPIEIPNVGLYAAIVDSEGNRVGVLQPGTRGAL